MSARVFTRRVLGLCGIGFLGLGLLFALFPDSLLSMFGTFVFDASAKAEIRSVYGGVHLTVGVYLLIAAGRNRGLSDSVLLLALLGGVVGSIRLLSWWMGAQVSPVHASIGLLETLAGLLLLGLFIHLQKGSVVCE